MSSSSSGSGGFCPIVRLQEITGMSRDEAIQTMSVVILAEVGNTGAQEELEEMDPFRRRCALRMRVVSESLRQAAEEETRVRYRSVAEARRSGLTPIRPPGLERLRPLSRRQILHRLRKLRSSKRL